MKNHETSSSVSAAHPLPLSYFINQNIASRSTLWRWGREGLRILRVGGRSYICPLELTKFMVSKHEAGQLILGRNRN